MGRVSSRQLGWVTAERGIDSKLNDATAQSDIGFFESDVASISVPRWANWLLDVGLKFPPREIDNRRSILIVSTPCDAPAAGLVALGVVMRDLAREAATDESGHVAALHSFANQFLMHCRMCRQKCYPKLVGCGFETESSGVINAPPRPGKSRERKLHVHSLSDDTLVLTDAHGCRDYYSISDVRQRHLHPAGRPKLATPANKPSIAGQAFSQLKRGWEPRSTNLQRSYSGTCFVGRRTGRDATREWLNRSGFILNGHRFPLSDMLTISGWGTDSVSRLRYASTRGGSCHFDREGLDTETAIVDGVTELVDSLACPSLRGASMIAVVPRDSAQDKLDLLAQALHELGYQHVREDPAFLSSPPRGICISWRVGSK